MDAKLFLSITIAISGVYMSAAEKKPPFEIQVANYKTYEFEDGNLNEFKAEGPSAMVVSDKAYAVKSGKSLGWKWTGKGASLVYKNSEAFRNLTGKDPDDIVYDWVTCCSLSSFSIWIFNPVSRDDKLWFEIGDGKKVDCRFYFNLNFVGWRNLKFIYGRDLDGFPNQKTADTLRIIAPDKPGELYFDKFAPRTEQDVRFFMPSKQAPWIKSKKKFRPDIDCDVKGRIYPDMLLPGETIEIKKPEKLSGEQLAVLKELDKKVFAGYRKPAKRKVTDKQMAQISAKFLQHDIRRLGGGISGMVNRGSHFWGEIGRIGVAYHQSSDLKQRKELLEMFNSMIDLALQLGHGTGYSLRAGFAYPIWLMKDGLKKSGRFEKLITLEKDLNGVDRFYFKDDTGSADNFNTLMDARFMTVMLQDNTPEKWRDLTALKLWLDRSATDGVIKPDGSFHHHGMIYNGYNLGAVGPVVKLLKQLDGTPFESIQMHKAIKRVVLSMAFYSGRAEAPQLWGGRWRSGGALSLNVIENMMYCGNPGEKNEIDCDIAPIYLYIAEKRLNDLIPENKTKSQVRREMQLRKEIKKTIADLRAKGIKPVNSIRGHLTLNHAASSVHRRGDWVFTVKGQKKGYNINEIYGAQAGANSMGRYLSYGAYQIISKGNPVNAKYSGFIPSGKKFNYNGWDFNFWPGTTVRELPYSALRSHFMVEERLTDEVFCGGCSLGDYGIFAMKFREELPDWNDPLRMGPPTYWLGKKEFANRLKDSAYDTTFSWRKSMFFFDDYILALGSGIFSEDKQHRVCTVILQNHLTSENQDKFLLNGSKAGFPVKKAVKGKNFLVDAYDNGYYIPNGNDKVEIVRQHQNKPFYNKWDERIVVNRGVLTPSEGDTELVLIDHGKAPQDAGYEYAVLVDAGAEKTRKFADKIPYTVYRKDATAHIVSDRQSGITAYAIFDAGKFNGYSDIKSVSRPCLLMVQGDRISICDPDFGEYIDYDKVGKKGTDITITLKNGKKLKVHCAEGLPVMVK